jgi:hypothetical protein
LPGWRARERVSGAITIRCGKVYGPSLAGWNSNSSDGLEAEAVCVAIIGRVIASPPCGSRLSAPSARHSSWCRLLESGCPHLLGTRALFAMTAVNFSVFWDGVASFRIGTVFVAAASRMGLKSRFLAENACH